MSDYRVTMDWDRGAAAFTDSQYSRAHRWTFDGGLVVPGSASPQVVRAPYSAAAAVDPEEAFVASLSSCHLLWFLSIASDDGYVVDRYHDDARGRMGRNADGRMAMLEVVLRPRVRFSGDRRPDVAELMELHDRAHHECFIANSVRTTVRCEPVLAELAAG